MIAAYVRRHRRVLLLKGIVAVMLVTAHYFPGHPVGLAVNLLWLFLF